MKKINKIMFLLISIILFASSNKVNALYNGSAGTSFSGSGGGSCGSLKNCTYGNPGKIFMQARLYYIENGSFTQIGKTFYFVNSSAYDYLKNTELKNQIISINASSYQDMRNKLNSYFLSNNAITNNGKAFLNKVTNSDDYTKILKKDSQAANKNTPATKGYRIVIEPALLYANPTFSSDGRALMTVKGMAGEARRIHTGSGTNGSGTYSYNGYDMPSCTGKPGANANCSYPLLGLEAQAQYLFTEFRDVGISGASKSYCENVNTDQLADMKNGCGLNMIDLSKYANTSCYIRSVLGDKLKCEKYNQNNIKNYSEIYRRKEKCTKEEKAANINYTLFGKKINDSGTCKLYCKESAVVSFPGNISDSVRQGSYFEWPTLPNDSQGLFKMSMTSSISCTIINESGADTVAPTIIRECVNNTKELNKDECRANSASGQGTCPSSEYKSDGMTSNSCSKLYCNSGYTLSGNRCISYKKVCPSGSGQRRVEGNVCAVYKCPRGYDAYTGQYSSLICKKEGLACPEGYNSYNDMCRKDISITPYYYSDFKCYDGGIPDGYGRCKKTNYSGMVNGRCYGGCSPSGKRCACTTYYNATKISVPYCPDASYTLSGDECTKTLWANKIKRMQTTQASRTTESLVNGDMITANPLTTRETKKCSSGYTLINGYCYKVTSKSITQYKCPDGFKLDGTTCKNQCSIDKLKSDAQSYIDNIDLKASLKAGTNTEINEELENAKTVEKYNNEKLSYSRTVYFKIRENKNRYFNKITREVKDTADKNNVNILDRGKGVVSLKPSDFGTKFNLEIYNVKVGKDNIFGSFVNNYTCNYDVTYDDKDECICPSGTTNSGVSVYDIYAAMSCNQKPSEQILNTCADKQEKVCNITDIEFSKTGCSFTCPNNHKVFITDCVKQNMKKGVVKAIEYCSKNTTACKDGDDDNKTCVRLSDNKEVSMQGCLNQGNSEKYCRESLGCTNDTHTCFGKCEDRTEKKNGLTLKYKLCNTNEYCSPDFSCSNSNEHLTKDVEYCFLKEIKETDMETALKKYANNRAKLESILAKCKPVSCLSDVNKAIFRIIDLNDPFPANTKIKYTGFSNNNKDSRKPGANWNSKDVVSKYILNARDSKGYALYSKEPLYRITLTPDIIKKIREYNSKNNYNNFNLKCMNNKKDAACMSEFLHNSNKSISKQIITGGKCRSISFDEKGFNSCYQK